MDVFSSDCLQEQINTFLSLPVQWSVMKVRASDEEETDPDTRTRTERRADEPVFILSSSKHLLEQLQAETVLILVLSAGLKHVVTTDLTSRAATNSCFCY